MDFNTIIFALASQQNWLGPISHHCESFFCLFCWCLHNHRSYIIVCLKCQLMIFITSLYNNAYIYTYIHTSILTYTLTHTLTWITFCLQYTIVVIWWYLVITSLTNNTDISLNYKKLELYCYKKKKKDKSIQFTEQKVITPVRFRQQPDLLA